MAVKYLMIGEVLKPQGVRGESKVKPYAADPDMFTAWKTLYLRQGDVFTPVEAVCSRVHDGFAYVTLGKCQNREDAEKLRGQQLWIDREHAGQLDEDEVYISDLLGCRLVDEAGETLGELTDVLQQGTVDTYVFKTPKGTLMAPALKDAFPAVDVEQRLIRACTARLSEVAVTDED